MANKLEKQFQSFLCQCKKPIEKFCLYTKCYKQSACCEQCESKNHNGHKTLVFPIQMLKLDIIENNNNLNEKIGRVISELDEFYQKKVKHATQQLEIKQEQIQIAQRINENNFQDIFYRLKEQIEIKGNKFQYKNSIIEDLQISIKQLYDSLAQKLQVIPDLFNLLQVKEKEKTIETATANLQSEIINNSEIQKTQNVQFESTLCNLHNQVINKICLSQECKEYKFACDDCFSNHKSHRGHVINYITLIDSDHPQNKVIIEQDIIDDYFKNMQQQFDEFKNKIVKLTPNQLILQNIDQPKTTKELQLSKNIQVGKANQIIFYILNQNDFYYYYKDQISSLQNKLRDYWYQEPQSQPLQEQFQQLKNSAQSVIVQYMRLSFSQENYSQYLQLDSGQTIFKNNNSKRYDVACLNVYVQNYLGPYVFNIQKLTGTIGIGIAKLDLLQKNQFQLDSTQRIDIITSDAKCYNSNDKNYNSKDISFEIKESQQYQLTLNKSNKGLNFIIENYRNSEKRFQMEVQYDIMSQYVVFVSLYKEGSQIQILN